MSDRYICAFCGREMASLHTHNIEEEARQARNDKDITTERMLDEVDDEIGGLECAAGMCEPGSDERDHQEGILAVFKAIRARLQDYDTLRIELANATERAKSLEADNESLRRLLRERITAAQDLKEEVERLKFAAKDNAVTFKAVQKELDEAEAELERARPLLDEMDDILGQLEAKGRTWPIFRAKLNAYREGKSRED